MPKFIIEIDDFDATKESIGSAGMRMNRQCRVVIMQHLQKILRTPKPPPPPAPVEAPPPPPPPPVKPPMAMPVDVRRPRGRPRKTPFPLSDKS